MFRVVTAALIATVLLATSLNETRPAEHRVDSRSARRRRRKFLLGDRNSRPDLHRRLGIASFFHLASLSFILIGHGGLSPQVYSVFFRSTRWPSSACRS